MLTLEILKHVSRLKELCRRGGSLMLVPLLLLLLKRELAVPFERTSEVGGQHGLRSSKPAHANILHMCIFTGNF